MSCPYCKRDEGHYLGCRVLEKPGMFDTWKEAWELIAWAIVLVIVLFLVLWVVVLIFGGGD